MMVTVKKMTKAKDLLFVRTKTLTYQSSKITVPGPGFPQQSKMTKAKDLLFVRTKTLTYQSSNITVPGPGFPQQSYICLWTFFIPFTMELRHSAEKGLLQYRPLISTDRATKLSKPNLP